MSRVDFSQGYTQIQGSHEELAQLIKEMESGQIETLIIHGTNPGYGFADKLAFQQALVKVSLVIYTGDRNDETGLFAHYVLPDQ